MNNFFSLQDLENKRDFTVIELSSFGGKKIGLKKVKVKTIKTMLKAKDELEAGRITELEFTDTIIDFLSETCVNEKGERIFTRETIEDNLTPDELMNLFTDVMNGIYSEKRVEEAEKNSGTTG